MIVGYLFLSRAVGLFEAKVFHVCVAMIRYYQSTLDGMIVNYLSINKYIRFRTNRGYRTMID